MKRLFCSHFLLLLIFFVAGCTSPQIEEQDPHLPFVRLQGVSGSIDIVVEIPTTQEEFMQGLMYRESLAEDAGMLFIFGYDQELSFWMKNTLIPLDLIYIGDNLTITSIVPADPCTADPCKSYPGYGRYVLEVNQGFSEQNGVVVGSEVELFVE